MRGERTTNYYTLLEVLPTATEDEIKRSWHEQIQVWHPDRFNHSPTLHRKAEARTQLINQAYQTLSDPTLRTRTMLPHRTLPPPHPPHVHLLPHVRNQPHDPGRTLAGPSPS